MIFGLEHPCEWNGCTETVYSRAAFCSPRCRAAAWREGKRATPREELDCELCGMPFLPRYGNQRICDYNSGQADADCKELQEELDDTRQDELYELKQSTCDRDGCEVPTYRPGRGRPKRFCSPRCRTAHYRAEKRQLPV